MSEVGCTGVIGSLVVMLVGWLVCAQSMDEQVKFFCLAWFTACRVMYPWKYR